MSIYKDQIVIVDLEATCWEGYTAPAGQVNEIIEIGVCLFEIATHELSAKRSLLVRPVESVISDFCTALTTITQPMVDTNGIAFAEACSILEKEYNTRNRLWASWGAFDKTLLHQQCKRHKVRYPMHDKHINLKRIYSDVAGERMSMKLAMERSQVIPEGTQHRGDDDAWNSARLLHKVLEENPAALKRYGI